MKNSIDIIDKIAKTLIRSYQQQLKNVHAIASGQLKNTATYELHLSNGSYQIILKLQDYWKEVEYGRRAGKYPPPGAIAKWIRVKHIVPRKGATNEQLTYLISRSISKHKIRGRHPLQRAQKQINGTYNNLIDELVEILVEPLEDELKQMENL